MVMENLHKHSVYTPVLLNLVVFYSPCSLFNLSNAVGACADTIKPLRTGLTEKGWHTLSVQMPVLGKEAKYYDYVPIFPYSHERIDAAINFYKAKGIDNIAPYLSR
jgi:hypothetical protein